MASLTELFEFLSSPNPSARHLALQNLLGHTPKSAPQRNIFIPTAFAGISNGGGLQGGKPSAGPSSDDVKVQALKDLTNLCRDQAVSVFELKGNFGLNSI